MFRGVLTFRECLAESIGDGETSGPSTGNDEVVDVQKLGSLTLDEMFCTDFLCLGNDECGLKHRCQQRDGKGLPVKGPHGYLIWDTSTKTCFFITRTKHCKRG